MNIGDNSNVISELKDQLDSLTKTINETSKIKTAQYEKIVIYVDDLDKLIRDAVAILELLKIFLTLDIVFCFSN